MDNADFKIWSGIIDCMKAIVQNDIT